MATQNQINWMRNVEEQRHNRVTEQETGRHNIATEAYGYYDTNMRTKANMYSADKSYAGSIYSANMHYAGTKYASDKSYASSIYSSDTHYAASKYSADKNYQGTVLTAGTNRLNTLDTLSNNIYVRGLSNESAKYVADKNYESAKYKADKDFEATRYVPEAGDVWYTHDMSTSQVNASKNVNVDKFTATRRADQYFWENFSNILKGIGSIIPF